VLDGSRDRTKIALDNPNFLRAIYVANSKLHLEEDEDFMATFSLPKDAKELFAIVRSACRHIEMDSAVEAAMERAWQMAITQEAKPITSEHEVEAFFQEVLRRLMPIKCPPAALLPGLERHGEVWDHNCKGRCLGEGSFGTVNQACDRFTGSKVAIKEIKLEDKEDKSMEESKLEIVKEFELLRDLSHPNLLRVFDLYVTDSTLFLVTEFAPCGDLNRYVSSPSKVDERWVAAVTRQVLSACGYLHRHQIVHHDVKPANVLVTASFLDAPEEKVPVVLLADFGLSQMENFIAHEAQKAASACYGTPCYMPPESSHGLSGPKTDVYATGILLYEMLSGGHAPEPVSDEGEVADIDWSLLAHCSSDAITTSKALMAPLVGDRFSCKDALQLEWLWPRPSSYNEDAVEAVETGSNQMQASSDVKCEGAAKLSMNVVSNSNRLASGYGSSPKIDATAIRTTMTAIEQGVAKLSTNVDCNFLSRVAMNMLAIQLPRAELENARQIFLALDSDRDGVLSEADLVSAFAHCGKGNAAAKEALFAADIRRQGILEFCEVAAACIDVALLPQGIVYGISEKMFAQLHGPDNGVAYLSLLERFAGEDECDDDNLTEMLHRCDSHGDGHLTKEDFFKIWGLELLPDWRTPSPPEPPLASVRMLRGDVNVCHIEGGVVMSQNFATFGQPSCARSSGCWYYEVHIRKYESPQIGWADEDFIILQEPCDNGVGDDAHSWGVDGERQCKWHDGQDAYEPSIPWAHPLVLGCALDLGPDGRRQMFFSVDGQWDSTPAFQDFAIDGALYPAGSGILDGRFCFKSSECVFQPPDSTYDYLET
jgi:serine/threonine protein kinase